MDRQMRLPFGARRRFERSRGRVQKAGQDVRQHRANTAPAWQRPVGKRMLPSMAMLPDTVTLTLPRALVPELPALAADLVERMHELLERNTEGTLANVERAELETFVSIL